MASVQNALEIKGGVNGLKMIIGAALIVLAGQIEVLNDLVPVLPDWNETLQKIIELMKHAISALEWVLKILGNGFLGLGFLDKTRKFFMG